MKLIIPFINNKKQFALLLVFLSTLFASAMGACLKYVLLNNDIFVVGFLRFFFGMIIILPYIIYTKFSVFKTYSLKLQIIRSSINLPAMYLGFSALSMIPFEKNAAINFIVPIFVTVLAVIFLKEKIYLFRISALVIGFLGMLIIIRPGFITFELGVKIALIASFLWALAVILAKTLAKNDSAITILAYQYLFMTLFTLILGILNWEYISYQSLLLIFLAAIFGTIFHLAINHAFKIVDLTYSQPVSFLSLIWASGFGIIFFKEVPDLYTWIGAIIIFISVLIITFREAKLNKDISKQSLPLQQ